MSGAIVVSAPGKVFLAGGYLVLDQKHTALTFALDARIQVEILDSNVSSNQISVYSPQFSDGKWQYAYEPATGLQDKSSNPNPFVETALLYSLSYVNHIFGDENAPLPSEIVIMADNDYYSLPEDREPQSKVTKYEEKFHVFNKPIREVNKTGLGSSAALVTAFIGAILEFAYARTSTPRPKNSAYQEHLHRLAQLAHCAAQGKVGSGFDVASAVYGSCIYRRFSPSIPERVGSVKNADFGKRLADTVQDTSLWDYEVNKHRKVSIPKGLRLVMCDVDGGSETPGMVRQVLKWRSENLEAAEKIWTQLQKHNDELADRLQSFSEGVRNEGFVGISENFRQIRHLIRDMSFKANVPIEPQEQTALLDACSALPGVIGGVVPGAGGYDAITLLIEDDEQVVAKLKQLLQSCRFGANEGKVRLLSTRGEMEGARIEASTDSEQCGAFR